MSSVGTHQSLSKREVLTPSVMSTIAALTIVLSTVRGARDARAVLQFYPGARLSGWRLARGIETIVALSTSFPAVVDFGERRRTAERRGEAW